MEDERKKNKELDRALTTEKNQRKKDKSSNEEMINSFQNQFKEMNNRIDDMNQKYSREIKNLKDENEKTQKENEKLKMKLDITKKKVQKLQDIVNNQREDINFLANFASYFSHQLDDVLDNLNKSYIQYSLS